MTGKIAELCKYIKDNLSNSIRCLLDTMLAEGELDLIIKETLTDFHYRLPNTVNVKMFGAKGDGIINDTQAFIDAIKYMCVEGITGLYIPTGTYLLDYLSVNENTIIYGCGSVLNLRLPAGSELTTIKSGSNVRDLTFNCLNEDRQWNRIDMSNQSNIKIENCIITGFRDPNEKCGWGLYMKNSKNIKIKNCKFDNNTQSDIAITENTENVEIINCSPLKDYMRINAEPNGTGIIKNMKIKGCKVSFLTMLGNSPSRYNIQNLKLHDNEIDKLILQNTITELVNNDIKEIQTSSFSNIITQNINSIGYEKELNNDIYLKNIQQGDTNLKDCWKMGYANKVGTIKRAMSETKGDILVLNPEQIECSVNIERTFDVKEGEQYAFDTLMNTKLPSADVVSGRGLNIYFYNQETLVEKVNYLIDRSTAAESEFIEKNLIVTIPEGVNKMRVIISNYTTSNKDYRTNWKYIKIHKINLKEKIVLKEETKTTGSALPKKINAYGEHNQCLKGDTIYLNNGIDFAGVCIESGNPGTWKKISLS